MFVGLFGALPSQSRSIEIEALLYTKSKKVASYVHFCSLPLNIKEFLRHLDSP